MYKIMIHIDTHTNDTWFYYQEEGKDYVANSLEEIRETVLTLIDVYGEDYIKIVKQETGDDMNGSVETFLYDSTDNYEELVNRPFINGVEIVGELSLAELGIQPVGNYATNERVNQVEAKVDAIDLEPYATMDYLDEVVAGIDFSASNENITGVKTFSVLPRSTVMPTSEDELTNKSYVDHGVETCASKEYVDSLLANINVNVVKQLSEEVIIINDYESGIYQPVYNGARVRLYNENRTEHTEITSMTNSMLIWNKEKRTFLAIFGNEMSIYSYYGTTSESYRFGKNVVYTFKEQEINGKKTFTTLPETSIVPTLANQLVNKAYVDNLASQNKGIQVLTANVNKHLDNGIYLINKDGLSINAAASTSVSYKYGTMVFKDSVYNNGMHFHVYAALDYDPTNGPQFKISYVAAGSYRFTHIYVPFKNLATIDYVDTAISNIETPEVNLDNYATIEYVDKAISASITNVLEGGY